MALPPTDKAVAQQHAVRNPYAEQFSAAGTQLLERTERPNIITLAQFQPFMELFKIDPNRYKIDKRHESDIFDKRYEADMNTLYMRWRYELGINHFFPTIVIESKENPKELYFIDRTFTRILSDILPQAGAREKAKHERRVMGKSQEEILLAAAVHDVMEANSTPEQHRYFTHRRIESALITKNFVEKNLVPKKREALMGEAAPKASSTTPVSNADQGMGPMVFDDDD